MANTDTNETKLLIHILDTDASACTLLTSVLLCKLSKVGKAAETDMMTVRLLGGILECRTCTCVPRALQELHVRFIQPCMVVTLPSSAPQSTCHSVISRTVGVCVFHRHHCGPGAHSLVPGHLSTRVAGPALLHRPRGPVLLHDHARDGAVRHTNGHAPHFLLSPSTSFAMPICNPGRIQIGLCNRR